MTDQIIASLLTLATVVVTSVLTYVATRGADSARWKREQKSRWDARKLEALADYADAVKLVLTRSWDICGSMGLGTSVSPTSREVGGPWLRDAESARGSKFEVVQLLANPQTIEAARAWHTAVWAVSDIAMGKTTATQHDLDVLWAECFAARDAFHSAARADLRVGLSRSDQD